MKTIISLLLLAVVNLIHCREDRQMIVSTLQGVLQKLEDISDTLKGHEELLQRIPDVQQKLEHLENNHQGLSQEMGQCLRGDDLQHLTYISAAAHQEIKSFHEEMSGIISWAEKDIDECIEGRAECDSNAKCTNTLGSYSCSCNPPFQGDGRTCSCPPGFASNGDICEDIDECSSAEGKGVCVPNAVCKNSIGSYSCSCNKPFEGDGRTSCEFHCRSPAKFFSGLGCLKLLRERLSYHDMNDFCQDEGGRLLTLLNREQLNDVEDTFSYYGSEWFGVYDGKWTNDEESLVPEDLWWGGRGYQPDPSKRCGTVDWDASAESYKLVQNSCSDKYYGYCQFQQ